MNLISVSKDKERLIRRILVCVDGSKSSIEAADMAIRLSQKHGADLTALHAIPPTIRCDYIEIDSLSLVQDSPDPILAMAKAEGQKCVDTVKERASKIGIKIHTEVILSELSAVKPIVEYAEEQKIDLLVLGRSGMSGIKKMLLGSTASGVVTYAHCPVLVVK